MSEISSGLVAVAWLAPSNYEWPSHFFSMTEIRNGEPLVRLSDAEAIINDLQTLVIAENQRKQQLEAEVALMKVECGESQYCAGCNDAAKIIEEQVERIKVLEAQNKGLQSGLDTDYAQLYQEQVQIGTKQSAALKLARDALSEGVEYVDEPPERNCTCHLAPPCNDCVDHSAVREFFIDARKALAAIDDALGGSNG